MSVQNLTQKDIKSFFVNEIQDGVEKNSKSNERETQPKKRRYVSACDSRYSEHNNQTMEAQTTDSELSMDDEMFDDVISKTCSEDEQTVVRRPDDDDGPITKSWMLKMFAAQEKAMENKMKSTVSKAVARAIGATNRRLQHVENENKTLKSVVHLLYDKINQLTEDCNHNAQYSRKNTVRILGIPEPDARNVSREDCKTSVCQNPNILEKIPGVISPDDIEVTHRLGTYSESSRYPRPIIVKFKFRGAKDNLIQRRRGLKGTNVIIYEDLSPGNRKLLYDLKQNPEIDQAWSANGKILGRLKRGDIANFTVTSDIDSVIQARLRVPRDRNARSNPTNEPSVTVSNAPVAGSSS